MYGPDPIIYRRDHGLLDYNERMAMIVQKVVGRRFGDWFFPFAAGVMFSRNVYGLEPEDPQGGRAGAPGLRPGHPRGGPGRRRTTRA